MRPAEEATGSITASPQVHARAGGLLYLFIIVAAGFGEIVARKGFD